MVTRITMPRVEVPEPKRFEACALYLARSKSEPEDVMTVIKGNQGGVLYFEGDNVITHSSLSHFEETYELIREYRPGETLSITR